MKKTRKILSILLICAVFLTGCSKKRENNHFFDYTIGINQLMEHPALDDARRGFEDELKDLGINCNIEYQNAQGDIPNTISISQKFIKDDVDLILAIGTPAAQSTKQLQSQIPVLFTAVTDPVESGLVKSFEKTGSNITGTSDMANIEDQLKLFHLLDPNIKNIGVIYNLNEANSLIQLKETKEVATKYSLNIVDVGINNINEVQQSLEYMISKVDAVYLLSDNMIASSAGLVSKKLIDNKLISISAEESQVKNGMLLTNGLSYYELGRQTGQMAKEILVNKKDPRDMPVEKSKTTDLKYNYNTMKSLALDEKHELFKNSIRLDN